MKLICYYFDNLLITMCVIYIYINGNGNHQNVIITLKGGFLILKCQFLASTSSICHFKDITGRTLLKQLHNN